jgi:hypothetical protein
MPGKVIPEKVSIIFEELAKSDQLNCGKQLLYLQLQSALDRFIFKKHGNYIFDFVYQVYLKF